MIDVLLSVRNGGGFLCKSIESVLNQTFQDFFLYIVDDASTDDSSKIIDSYKDKRIIKFQNKFPLGLTKNLNFLFRQGKSGYVARLDADDISRGDRLEKQMRYLTSKDLDFVGANANLINTKGEIVGERICRKNNLKQDLIKFNMFPHSSWLGKRKMFEDLNGYDEKFKYAQDYDFLLRGVKRYRLGICPEKLIDLRWDADSLSLKHLKEQQKFAINARFNAIMRGDYSRINYVYLLKPLISYLMPSIINKIIYKIRFPFSRE